MTFKDLLVNLGYHPFDAGDNLRMRPIYRDSNNDTSLKVDKQTGRWFDFGISKHGTFEELVQLTLHLKSTEEAKGMLQSKFNFNPTVEEKRVSVKTPRVFTEEEIKTFISDHSYWIQRGISQETLTLFKGGVCNKGKMKNRYCLPIYNPDGKIVGITGRTLINSKIKYKHIGSKSNWCYPLFFNNSYIESTKEVILIESPGCMLSLWDDGIRNTIVLFGTDCSLTILNYLLRLDPDKIHIALNNEPENANIGNEASKRLQRKLSRYFDKNQITISLPTKKDFGEMTREERLQWKEQYHVKA